MLRAPPTDAETLCRTDAPLGAHTIILVDATDRLESRHRRKLRAVLAQERARLAQYDRLTHDAHQCAPAAGAGDPVLEMPAAPARANQSAVRKRAHDAAAVGRRVSPKRSTRAAQRGLIGGPPRASPILAGVRAVAADPDFGAEIPRRRLVLVSDLLEHDPQGFSLYVSDAD